MSILVSEYEREYVTKFLIRSICIKINIGWAICSEDFEFKIIHTLYQGKSKICIDNEKWIYAICVAIN